MRRFIAAGPLRSGSTWLFNAIRLIASPCYSEFHNVYDAADPSEHHVVKIHEFDPSLSGLVMVTERPIDDRIASAIRFGILLDNPHEIDNWLAIWAPQIAAWKERARLVVEFERILRRPAEAVQAISVAMGIKCNPQQIAAALADLREPVSGIDPITLIHRGHRTCVQ